MPRIIPSSLLFFLKVVMVPSFPLKTILWLVFGTYRKGIDNLMRLQKKKIDAYYCLITTAVPNPLDNVSCSHTAYLPFNSDWDKKYNSVVSTLLQVLEFLSENMSKHTLEQISYNLPFNVTKSTLQYLIGLR